MEIIGKEAISEKLPLTHRVKLFWDWFEKNEKELSEMLCADVLDTPDDIPNFVREGTDLISENIDFDLTKDHEFIFKVNGCPDLFIIYPYIISLMPDKLKSKWKFFHFKQGNDSSFEFRMFDSRIDIREINEHQNMKRILVPNHWGINAIIKYI